jgi:hypothetical protein
LEWGGGGRGGGSGVRQMPLLDESHGDLFDAWVCRSPSTPCPRRPWWAWWAPTPTGATKPTGELPAAWHARAPAGPACRALPAGPCAAVHKPSGSVALSVKSANSQCGAGLARSNMPGGTWARQAAAAAAAAGSLGLTCMLLHPGARLQRRGHLHHEGRQQPAPQLRRAQARVHAVRAAWRQLQGGWYWGWGAIGGSRGVQGREERAAQTAGGVGPGRLSQSGPYPFSAVAMPPRRSPARAVTMAAPPLPPTLPAAMRTAPCWTDPPARPCWAPSWGRHAAAC